MKPTLAGASWRWVKNFTSIPDLSSSLEAVASRTYQRALGAGFRDDEEHRCRLESFGRRGCCGWRFLYRWCNTCFLARSGLLQDSAFLGHSLRPGPARLRAGNLMFHRMVDELAREGVERLDFGLGDAFYKRRFGDTSWREKTVSLFAPTAKGALLKSAVGFCGFLDGTARRLVEASGQLDWVKTRWRRRVTPAPESDSAS